MSRRLKLLLVGLSGLVLLLVAAAVSVPFLFRDRLDALVRARLDAAIDADVRWQTLSISVIRGFPHLRVTAQQLRICNRPPFQGICLAQIDEASVRLGLVGLLRRTIDVRSVELRRPRVQLEVREDGAANWDIFGSAAAGEQTPADRGFRVALRHYQLEDAHLVYADRASGVFGELIGLDHDGSGDFSRSRLTLETTTHADAASLRIGGVPYLRDARVDLRAAVDLDRETGRATVRENELRLNALTLGADGWIARAGDGLSLDLGWSSRTDDLRGLVSLLPEHLVGNLEGLETAGTVAIAGRAAGVYGEAAVPAIDARVSVTNGRFKYASLPAAVDQIALEATIAGPQARDWDALVADVPRFAARVAGNPVEGRLRAATLVSDPALDLAIRGVLDLADLPRVVPFTPGDSLTGHAEADVRLAGRLSALQQKPARRFAAEGFVNLREVLYQRQTSTRGLRAAALSLTFNPDRVQLLADGAGIGDTEVTLRGRFEDYLTWWLGDGTLKGSFEVSGETVDLAALLRPEPSAVPAADQAETTGRTLAIPATVDLSIAANARRVSYGSLELGGVRGTIRVHDQQADLRELGFGLFGGSVTVSGTYDTRMAGRPKVALRYQATGLDIQQAARHSSLLRAVAPVVVAAAGSLSSTLELSGTLDRALSLDLASLTGRGTVAGTNLRLDKFPPLAALARSLKIGALEQAAALGDVRFTFALRDGRMVTTPFDVQVGDLALRVGGSTAFNGQAIDYDLTGRVPTSVFGEAARDRVTEWLGSAASEALPASLGLTARLTGTVAQPAVALAFDAAGAAHAARAAALAKARTEADRLLAAAEAEAAVIQREAEEAAAKLKAEAEEAAARLVADARGPLAQAAARLAAGRLRQEADTRAQQLVSAAYTRSQSVIEAARRTGAERVEAASPR